MALHVTRSYIFDQIVSFPGHYVTLPAMFAIRFKQIICIINSARRQKENVLKTFIFQTFESIFVDIAASRNADWMKRGDE